ncbi:MarR family winged helix-turn-helix transcriptional regulator [Streptomyces malaysiensis]|uniref:MarR family winged helix-turn-helix transcriptional regulator n=1 Tax=Streptomyces malaysiensis TaxID=92644 RepID=UPI002B297C5B|nr:MarR family winged helix-turn-helix transcriptional regulator [Streptomyces malaysiensis]
MSAAAALMVLRADPGVSVTELGRRVGLTQSAAVRMVDGLERESLVERRRTVGNWTGVHPTGKGRRTAGQLLTSRTSRLTGVLDVLGDTEVRDLGALLAKLLDGLYQGSGSADRMCRLCPRRGGDPRPPQENPWTGGRPVGHDDRRRPPPRRPTRGHRHPYERCTPPARRRRRRP